MGETRIDMRAAGAARDDSHAARVALPVAWFRRRKTLLFATFVLVCVCVWLWVDPSAMPAPSLRRKRVDPDIRKLLRTTPGAIPGIPSPPGGHEGRNGEPYPSRRDLTTLLIEHLREPSFRVDESVWREWAAWLEPGAWPDDAHVQFLTELKRIHGGDLGDVKRYLHSPIAWEMYHLQLEPLTVFSKSYCPYSRGAKSLLTDYGANFTVYEVDLRYDFTHIAPLLWALTGHRTYPKVLTGSHLVVRSLTDSRVAWILYRTCTIAAFWKAYSMAPAPYSTSLFLAFFLLAAALRRGRGRRGAGRLRRGRRRLDARHRLEQQSLQLVKAVQDDLRLGSVLERLRQRGRRTTWSSVIFTTSVCVLGCTLSTRRVCVSSFYVHAPAAPLAARARAP